MRTERKWFKYIVSLFIITIAILLADIPITAFKNETALASETNADSGGGDAGTGTWGSTYRRTGWLVYLVKKDTGNIPTVNMTINGETKEVPAVSYVGYPLDKADPDPTKLKYVYTRVGKHYNPQKAFRTANENKAEWGPPFDNDQNGRGKQVAGFFSQYDATKKQWLAHKNGITSKTNKYAVRTIVKSDGSIVKEDAWNNDLAAVDKYLGSEACKLYKSNDYYLCFEAVAIHRNKPKTDWIAFSAYGVAQMIRETCGVNEQENFIDFSANDCLQIGTYLDKNWPNLPQAVPEKWSHSVIYRKYIEKSDVKAKTTSSTKTMGYGFGMAALKPSGLPVQRTYDEESLVPSAAPKETTGNMTIVKVYVEEYEVDIPKAFIDTTISTTVTKSESLDTIEEDTAEDDISEEKIAEMDASGSSSDSDTATDSESHDELDEAYDESIGATGGLVYDPELDGLEDDKVDPDKFTEGELDESEAGASDVYDTDDTGDSGEDESTTGTTTEAEGDDDTFDAMLGADVDIDFVTVKSYRQVEKVTGGKTEGKGSYGGTDSNPGVAVTKKVGNEILILDESGDAKDVTGGTG